MAQKRYATVVASVFLVLVLFLQKTRSSFCTVIDSSMNAKPPCKIDLLSYIQDDPTMYCPSLDDPSYIIHLASSSTTPVEIRFYVEGLSSVNEVSMDYELDIYLRSVWEDPRLGTGKEGEIEMFNNLDILNAIWIPDVYFSNAKSASFQSVTVPNFSVKIHSEGIVTMSRRVLMKLHCIMNLKDYPMDAQNCTVRILNYMYNTSYVLLHWEKSKLSMNPNLELPEFLILDIQTYECDGTYSTGIFSCLEAKILLQRRAGYHVFQTLIPTMAIVMISWISFWVKPEAVPARVTLSITTLLTLSTRASGLQATLPPVSYAKAIDIWMTVCTCFVFFALLEFTLVYYISDLEMKPKAPQTIQKNQQNNVEPMNLPNGAGGNWAVSPKKSFEDYCFAAVNGLGADKLRNREQIVPIEKKLKKANSFKKQPRMKIVPGSLREKLSWKKLFSATRIDQLCRICYPIAFFGFVASFWIVYKPQF